jgi:hypothetical protein
MALAILVPALALAAPRPARFGWQMYSVAEPAPRAWLEAGDGTVEEWDLAAHLAVLRGDIPDAKRLARAICVLERPAAAIVELRPDERIRVTCG